LEYRRYRLEADIIRSGIMKDPAELIKRASELKERADNEPDPEIRDRLLRMSGYYIEIAEHESWLLSHPISIASFGDILVKK